MNKQIDNNKASRSLKDGDIRWLDYDPSDSPVDLLAHSEELFTDGQLHQEFLPNVYLVKTPINKYIQVNILTLSTKYHLKTGLKYLPEYQIINTTMFDKVNGGNYGNFEFLIFLRYYALPYMQKDTNEDDRRAKIICTPATKKRIINIWQEIYSGPTLENLLKDCQNKDLARELHKEFTHFAEKDKQGNLQDATEFITFYVFDNSGQVKLENDLSVQLLNDKTGSYIFYHQDQKFTSLHESSRFKSGVIDVEFKTKIVSPHTFATTVIGGGSGFTPDMQTASFVQWVKRKGTLIDLPEFPFMHLDRSGIEKNDIVRVMLTHVHADHVGGFLWLISEYVKGTIDWQIWTTSIIFQSMLRLMSNITRASLEQLKSFIPFKELKPGITYDLPEGGHLEIEYSLHSVPAIESKFTVNVVDKEKSKVTVDHPQEKNNKSDKNIFKKLTITHSGDTLFDPEYTAMMVDQKLMSEKRKASLDNFVFTDGLIFHEVGGPPLHTVNPKLKEYLSKEQLGRLYAFHNAVDQIDVDLNIAEEGSTLGLITTTQLSHVEIMVTLLDKSSFFTDLPMEQKIEIAHLAEKLEVKQGDQVIIEGAQADKLYLIENGVFDIFKEGEGLGSVARLSRFDTFGEAGITHQRRTASVYAQTNGILYSISGDVLKELVPESYLTALLEKQSVLRPFFGTHGLFRSLPTKTQQLIAQNSEKHIYQPGEIILRLGVNSEAFSIIAEGEAEVLVPEKDGQLRKVADLKKADFFGEMSLINQNKTMARIVASTECTVYLIPGSAFRKLMETNYQFSYLVTNIMQKRKKFNNAELKEVN